MLELKLIFHLQCSETLALLKSPTDLQSLQRIANMVRATDIQYPVSYITNRKIAWSYHINTLPSNSLLLSLPVRVQGSNVLRTVPFLVPPLLAKEAFSLTLIGFDLFGLTLHRCPSLNLHLLHFLLLVLLPFLKGSRTRRRTSH